MKGQPACKECSEGTSTLGQGTSPGCNGCRSIFFDKPPGFVDSVAREGEISDEMLLQLALMICNDGMKGQGP